MDGSLSLYFLRLLFWLKWKLLARSLTRNTTALAGILLALLLFSPMALGMGIACAIGFLNLPPPYEGHLLRGVLMGAYLLWIFSPMLGFALNDSYDITKLFVYPISVRRIFTGAILGSLLDFPILFLLPTLLAVFAGFTHDVLTFAVVFLALGLFLFHTLSLSQAILLATAGILRSRRYREVAAILVTVFSMTLYIGWHTAMRSAATVDWRALIHSDAWEGVSYLPPGLAARAITSATYGEMETTLGYLILLAIVTVGTVYLASWLIQKVYAGEAIRTPVRASAGIQAETSPTREVIVRPAHTAQTELGSRLPPVIEAMAEKEVKYLFRDPYFKLALMNLIYMLLISVFAFTRAGNGVAPPFFRTMMIWVATGMVLLTEMQLVCNIFGTDGGASTVLFSFPCSRRQILIGKNLTLFTALSIINLVFMIVLAGLAGVLEHVGLLFCWMELALIVFLAIGNVVSIYFPVRMVLRGWRVRQQSASRGCGYTFVYMGVMLGAFVILLPILAALMAPMMWIDSHWMALTIPLAIVYALGLYLLSLHFAEPLLSEREIEIIAKVSQTDE